MLPPSRTHFRSFLHYSTFCTSLKFVLHNNFDSYILYLQVYQRLTSASVFSDYGLNMLVVRSCWSSPLITSCSLESVECSPRPRLHIDLIPPYSLAGDSQDKTRQSRQRGNKRQQEQWSNNNTYTIADSAAAVIFLSASLSLYGCVYHSLSLSCYPLSSLSHVPPPPLLFTSSSGFFFIHILSWNCFIP